MRLTALIPIVLLAACDIQNDPANDQLGVKYDEERIRSGAKSAARTAKEVGSGLGNVASTTGRAIRNEVGDVDVDVDVRRTRNEALATSNSN